MPKYHKSWSNGAAELHNSVDLLCDTTAAELHNSVDLLCDTTAAELHNSVDLLCGTTAAELPAIAPKAWLSQGLPGRKPGWTNHTFLVFKPGLPDSTICAKSLVNQGTPGKPGKPGYSKNQENQTLTGLLKF